MEQFYNESLIPSLVTYLPTAALGIWVFVMIRRRGIRAQNKLTRSIVLGILGAFLFGPTIPSFWLITAVPIYVFVLFLIYGLFFFASGFGGFDGFSSHLLVFGVIPLMVWALPLAVFFYFCGGEETSV